MVTHLFTSSKLRQFLANNMLIVSAIFLLGFVFRISLLNSYGLWEDEVESITVARAGLDFIFSGHTGWIANQTVPFYLLIWSMVQVADPTVTAVLVRLPSALAGSLIVFPVFGLGSLLFNRATGIVAALAVALSPILLDYSLDLRPYSLIAFFTVTSVYCLAMAERTGAPGWWVGFAIVFLLNLLGSYMAVILVLPTLAPYIVFVLWTIWSRRQRNGFSNLFYALSAFIVVGIVSILMFLDLYSVSQGRPDLGSLSLDFVTNMFLENVSAFVNIGIPSGSGSLLSLILLLLAVLGGYIGVRSGKGKGVCLSLSICLISSLLLAVLATASSISTRYVLFAAPFYILLLAYSALEIPHYISLMLSGKRASSASSASVSSIAKGKTWPAGSLALATLLVLMFALGIYNYINPATHESLSYKPDFRGAAEFVSRTVSAEDVIVLADDPALGYNVTTFYLNGKSLAPVYDARDPLLYREKPVGSIYWVISSIDGNITQQIANPDFGWSNILRLEGVVVLVENAQGLDMTSNVERLAARIDIIHPHYRAVDTLLGTVKQARGGVAAAAQDFTSAGIYFPLAPEYLNAAQSFDSRGFKAVAWKQGLIAKFMEPYRPEIHAWFGEQLREAGYLTESQIELQVAQTLTLR